MKSADHTGDFCVIFGKNIHMDRNVQNETVKQLKCTKEARIGNYWILCVFVFVIPARWEVSYNEICNV
jgi:hypothetical protein